MKLNDLKLVLVNIISKSIKSFKFFIWKYCNSTQIKLEKKRNITQKFKKTKYKKISLDMDINNNFIKQDHIENNRWKLWNRLELQFGGSWLNFK
jgi:hypothetical protein